MGSGGAAALSLDFGRALAPRRDTETEAEALEDDTLGDPGVAECTNMRIRGWRFPSEGAEEPSDLSFSVVYSPQF